MSNAAIIATFEPGLDFRFRGRCVGGDGPNLSRYPNLAHSDDRGVFTHLAGVPVAEIALLPNAQSTVTDLDQLTIRLGITFDELLDALRYARATGQI